MQPELSLFGYSFASIALKNMLLEFNIYSQWFFFYGTLEKLSNEKVSYRVYNYHVYITSKLFHPKTSPRTIYVRNIQFLRCSRIIIFFCHFNFVLALHARVFVPLEDIWDPLFRISKAEALLFKIEFFFCWKLFMLFWIEINVAVAMIIC